MKKIFNLTVLSLVAAVFTSCEMSRDRETAILDEAFQIFYHTENRIIAPYMDMFHYVLKVDRLLKAESEYEQYYVASVLFGGKKNITYGDGCVKIGEDGNVSVTYTATSITEKGAEWQCNYGNTKCSVICTGENTWEVVPNIASYSYDNFKTLEELSMSVKVDNLNEVFSDPENNLFASVLDVSGKYVDAGTYNGDSYSVEVSFASSGSLEMSEGRWTKYYYGNNMPSIDLGVLDMTVKSDKPIERDEELRAAVSSSHISLKYMGVHGTLSRNGYRDEPVFK